jgi:outer membrane protein assembly factor BamB
MRIARTLLISSAAVVAGVALFAQGRNIGNDWPTALGDAQRTNWMRSDPNISIDSLAKPGFDLQWRASLEGQRGLKPAVQGVTVNGVTLFTPLSIVTGANDVIAIDNDTGETFWYKSFGSAAVGSGACAATPVAATRQAPLVPAAPTMGGAGGRGGRGGYSSAVGNPGEGAPIPAGAGRGGAAAAAAGRGAAAPAAGAPAADAAPPGAPVAGAPPAGAPPAGAPATPGAPPAAGRAGGGGGGFGRPSGVVYTLARDGMLHVVGLPSAKDTYKPAPFIPAGARATDLLAVNDVLYTSTTGKCGGSADAVYAMDLASATRTVVSYKTTGSPVGAVALTTDGTVVVVVTNGVVTLDPKTLTVKQSFTDNGTTFVTGPLVMTQNGKSVIAAGTKDGRIVLFDTTLSAPLASVKIAADASATFGADALAFFQEYSAPPPDANASQAPPQPPAAGRGFGGAAPGIPMVPGQPWLLASTKNTIVAFKLEPGDKPSLTPGWTSRALTSPAAPLVVNNVVFAVSSGQGGAGSAAVLYALNATTGIELWNSGTAIKSSMPGRALWTSNSQVYVGGNDGAVYAFGFPLERK